MTSPGELVRRLETFVLAPEGADLAQIAERLEQRQKILDELQNADTRALSPETRDALMRRVEAVRLRDQKLLSALRGQQEAAEKQLRGLLRGRSAARGYGAVREAVPSVFERRG